MFELVRRNNNHPVNTYNPFRDMEDLERSFFGSPMDFFSSRDLAEFKTDVTDEGDHYLLEADLPGFDKKDIHIDVDDDTLVIHAERHSNYEKQEKKAGYLRCERSYGSYSRSFNLDGIDSEKISAAYDNGVLKLTLPKQAPAKATARRLEIE